MQTKTIAETERVKERKRAQVKRGVGDVLVEPVNRDDEQMVVRHAYASGGDITETQHEENRIRDTFSLYFFSLLFFPFYSYSYFDLFF